MILDTYIDRAMTGTNDNRPDFQRMIKDSNKRQWNYVLVYKLDRFSRNKYETAIHKKTLKDNGVKVLSAMEAIPDGPEGIILEALLEGYERLNGHNKNVAERDVKTCFRLILCWTNYIKKFFLNCLVPPDLPFAVAGR
jgi:hypothetical protein